MSLNPMGLPPFSVSAILAHGVFEDASGDRVLLALRGETVGDRQSAEAGEAGFCEAVDVLVHGCLTGRAADKPTTPPSQHTPRQTARRQSVESGGTLTPKRATAPRKGCSTRTTPHTASNRHDFWRGSISRRDPPAHPRTSTTDAVLSNWVPAEAGLLMGGRVGRPSASYPSLDKRHGEAALGTCGAQVRSPSDRWARSGGGLEDTRNGRAAGGGRR